MDLVFYLTLNADDDDDGRFIREWNGIGGITVSPCLPVASGSL